MEPKGVKQRVTSLEFLVKTNLISDPAVREGLKSVLSEGEASVPQFASVKVGSSLSQFGVQKVDSSKSQTLEKYPTLEGKNIALIGFNVRHGDIVDALTPIYSEVTSKLELVGEYEGERVGGTGGNNTEAKHPGYVVTGFDIQRGAYIGREEVINFTIYWNRLTSSGIDVNDQIVSEKFASENYANITKSAKEYRAKEYRANSEAFISDFSATVSTHTSGETFLNDIEISETILISN